MHRTPRLLVLLVVFAAAGYLAGRAFWPAPQSAPPPAPPARPAPTTLPDFHLRDLASGQQRSIGDWRGQAVLLNFWATWCAPCRKEMPLLEQLHQDRGARGPAVIGIAIDREAPVRSFVGETGVTYPILVGQEDAMAVAEAFGPSFVGLPLSVVAAPGGEILAMHMGELHPQDLARIVEVVDALAGQGMTLTQAREALKLR